MEALLVLAGADRALHDRLSAALVRAGCRIAALADLDRLAQPARGSGSARVVLVAGGGGEAERAFLSRLMAERPELPVVRVAAADAGDAAHERDQVGHGLEGEQILVLAQERLPFVTVVAPAWRPQGVAVTDGQAQSDGHEVSSHAAHNSDGTRQ